MPYLQEEDMLVSKRKCEYHACDARADVRLETYMPDLDSEFQVQARWLCVGHLEDVGKDLLRYAEELLLGEENL